MKNIDLKTKKICSESSSDSPVFIVAEIGCNFEGDMGRAREMIRTSAKAGIDAVKFQTFIPEKLASKHAEKFWEIQGCPGDTALEEFKLMPQLTKEQYKELKNIAEREDILFFSTPEDESSFEMLNEIGMPMWKISSMNITHKPLIDLCASTRQPIILSTGASTIAEIAQALQWIEATGNTDISILHCISNYPTLDENVNLKMIQHIKSCFPDYIVGYSDHTIPTDGEGIIASAVALGARIIEKHFTFDNKRPGYDHAISADYEGIKRIVAQIRRVEKALGKEHKQPIESEHKARVHARRSIVAANNIPKGTVITRKMLDIKRPGTGIEPEFLDVVVEREARTDISEDTILQWNMI
jgi:N-acetylneuraminate synthase